MSPHWIVVPVLVPLVAALALLAAAGARPTVKRALSALSAVLLLAVVLRLLAAVSGDAIYGYQLGDWPAPFGITLLLDRLSALMLLLTALVAVPSLWYACSGADRRGRHFHALFQLQLAGLNGAFLAGDLFNLFVFFEVLLIASYGLLLLGGGRARSIAGLHYVVLNLAGSSLFLIAVAVIYGIAGSLNMADLSVRIAAAEAEELPLLRAGALLLLAVFALKAAAVPLAFWLPAAYSTASAPVAALFAIMTKVGVYAIVRVFMLMFGGAEGAIGVLAGQWLVPVGLATLAVGYIGALAADSLRRQLAYLLIGSVGTLLPVVGLFTEAALAAGLFYLVHTTLVVAGLFLLADVIARQRGTCGDRLRTGRRVAQVAPLGILFFAGALAAAGLPPLSGFLGKLLILDASRGAAWAVPIWTTVLVSSLLGTIALARSGSVMFWKTAGRGRVRASWGGALAPTLVLIAAGGVLVLGAAPLLDYTQQAARQLARPDLYTGTVLTRAPAWSTADAQP